MSDGTEQEPDERSGSGTAGLPAPDEVPPETLESIERERAERLDPANRPDGVQVDNTGRTFDSGAGKYTDDPDYDDSDRPFVTEDGTAPPKPE